MTEKYVAVYCRVSSSQQKPDSQKGELENYLRCYVKNQNVIWYEDVSNDHKLMDRPNWNRLEREMREGKVSKLVVWKLDRLGRSAGKLAELIDSLRLWGVGFVSVKESLDLETPTGRLMAGILASLSEWELEVIRMRIRAGKQRRRALELKQASRKGQWIKLTPQKLRKIEDMRAQGFKPSRIARAVDLSAGYVRRILRENIQPPKPLREPTPRIRRRAKHTKVTANDIQVLRNLIQQDLARTTIAKTLGWSRQHLYRMIRMYCGEEFVVKKTAAEKEMESDRARYNVLYEDWGITLADLVIPDDD